MCNTKAIIERNGSEELIQDDVDRIEFDGENVRLTNIFGEEVLVQATLRLIDNSAGRIVFHPV